MLDNRLIRKRIEKIKLLYDQIRRDLPDAFTVVYNNKTQMIISSNIRDDWDDWAYECLTSNRNYDKRNWMLYLNALYKEFSKYNS